LAFEKLSILKHKDGFCKAFRTSIPKEVSTEVTLKPSFEDLRIGKVEYFEEKITITLWLSCFMF